MTRYARNLLLKDFTPETQKKINDTKVLVCGLGGLGSAVITNLACVGVENFGFLDCDIIDESNFNRQYIHNSKNIGVKKTTSSQEWVKNYNPAAHIELFETRLCQENCEDIIKNFDIVVDCFDNWESKFLLNESCVKLSKPLVFAGVEGSKGQVMTIFKSTCLECVLSRSDGEVFRGITSPIVSIIGAIQANEVINIILNKPVLKDTILLYDLSKHEMKKIKTHKNSSCMLCGDLKK